MPKQIGEDTIERTRKRGRSPKRWTDEVEQYLNIMLVKDRQGSGQRPLGMEEDCVGTQGPQQTVSLEGEEENKKKGESERRVENGTYRCL
jgi:hypothetical protein